MSVCGSDCLRGWPSTPVKKEKESLTMIWLLFSGKYNSVTVKCFTCPESDKKHQSCPNVHHVKVCDHSTVILPGCRSRSRSKISMFCTDSSSQKGQSWCRLGNDFPMIYSVVNDLITRYSLTNLFVEILIQTMSHFSVFELDNSAYRLYIASSTSTVKAESLFNIWKPILQCSCNCSGWTPCVWGDLYIPHITI